MIRIGICDDLVEQLQIQEEMVRNIVCRFGLNTEIKCFQSGEDLLWEMEQKGNMDIILLDIEMGGINGVETARRIREKENNELIAGYRVNVRDRDRKVLGVVTDRYKVVQNEIGRAHV